MAERFAVFRPFLFWQRDVLVLPLPASTVGQADGAALMADDADTAMAEPRPWLGSHVSLAQFKVLTTFAGHESAGAQTLLRTYFLVTTLLSRNRTWRKEAVWGEIAYAFSEPVITSDEKADYAPTQILAETFRKAGCDGIRYKSRLGRGHSFAVFDVDKAALINCGVYETKGSPLSFTRRAIRIS